MGNTLLHRAAAGGNYCDHMSPKAKARWIPTAVYVITSGVLYFAFDATDVSSPLLLATVIALLLSTPLMVYLKKNV